VTEDKLQLKSLVLVTDILRKRGTDVSDLVREIERLRAWSGFEREEVANADGRAGEPARPEGGAGKRRLGSLQRRADLPAAA
jgi:hypothetical protein